MLRTIDDERLDLVRLDLQLVLQQLERNLLVVLGERHQIKDAHLVDVLLVVHARLSDEALVVGVELHVLVQASGDEDGEELKRTNRR